MPVITILIGVMLILVGVGGYGWAYTDAMRTGGYASPTALIPAIIGLIITILGGAATNERWRKHAMHGAILIALLGFIATVMSIPKVLSLLQGGTVERPIAVISQTLTAVLCLILVALGINSFVQARVLKKS